GRGHYGYLHRGSGRLLIACGNRRSGREPALPAHAESLVAQEVEEENRIAQNVAAPEPGRLDHEAPYPFKPKIAHGLGRPRRRAGNEVEQRADAEDDTAMARLDMGVDPDFLRRASHAHQSDIGIDRG